MNIKELVIQTMNSWVYEGFDVTYKTMGVDFDKLYYESDTYLLGKAMTEEGLEAGDFYQKDDGSIWCDLSSEKMDDKMQKMDFWIIKHKISQFFKFCE